MALFHSQARLHEISISVVCATNKGSDQQSHTRSLIRAFSSRLSILWVLSYWLNIIWSLKGGCRGSSESTHVKMPHCWNSHALAYIIIYLALLVVETKLAKIWECKIQFRTKLHNKKIWIHTLSMLVSLNSKVIICLNKTVLLSIQTKYVYWWIGKCLY